MNHQTYHDYGVSMRRHLHQHPELGRQECETQIWCVNQLKQMGYDITVCFGTGFYADLHVSDTLPRIAFRADMDALPATEKPGEVVISQNSGAAHLCGHDVHMAIALTAAKMMSDWRNRLRANIRFLFQPSEEMFRGGARGMIGEGALEGVDVVYGLHNDPQIDCGQIALHPGIMSSNGDQFRLNIAGKSAHASSPHLGLDALSEAVRLLTAFRTIITDRVDPNKAALISTCMLNAGEAPNILARTAELQGSIRSFDPTVHKTLINSFMEEIQESRRRGYTLELEMRGYPAINNHPVETQKVIETARLFLGEENVLTDRPPMVGSEDFSFFLKEKPGAFFFLGSGDHSNGINNPLHSNPFIVNEDCIMIGATIFAMMAGLEP